MRISRRRQRRVVLGALLLGTTTLVTVPLADRDAANAALPNNPYSCGLNDANRMHFSLSNGGTLNPCLSGRGFELIIPDQTSTVRANIQKIRSTGIFSNAIHDANGVTINGGSTYQLSFDSFVINTGNTGVTLKTIPAAAGQPAYTLTIAPDHDLTIGGNGVTTDMWADGGSWIRLNDNLLGVGCATVGFLQTNPCKITVSTFATLSWLLNGSSYNIYGMDLKFYFLATYGAGGAVPSGSSVQLPNTSITVS